MIEALRKAFGDQLLPGPQVASNGAITLRPYNLPTACEMVRFVRTRGCRLIPAGSGTKRHWTNPAGSPAVEMDMRSCERIVEYAPEDMTITVEAGITLASLSAQLAVNGQRLTLDPPYAGRATIGGILAANDSGPIRFAWGTARDIVIGMSMIEPDGGIIKSGGKVVKNVAGYDLHRLYIGSFGTLGPIATVTFRLRPVPESLGLVLLHPFDAGDAERMIAEVLDGETRPTIIDLLNSRAATGCALPGRLTLVLGFEDNTDAVAWQCERIVQTIGGEALRDASAQAACNRLREAAGASCETSFKATMLSSRVAEFVQQADQYPIRLVARAGSGVVYGLIEQTLPEGAWEKLQRAAANGEGSLWIRGRLPGSVARRFGEQRNDAYLSTAIQQAFDPDGTFAPERLA